MNTTTRLTRRQFLKSSTIALSALTVLPRRLLAQPPSKTLNIACIGVGGRGDAHVWTSLKENLVAICDISQRTLDGWGKRIEKTYQTDNVNKPLPKTFSDYRELFDKMGRDIDAVVVATPDHHHAPASMRAIKLGKHVYCEKPLTHNIHEARQLMLAARKKKVATQLGNQGRAEEAWRLLCEYLWAGIIGPVREVHIWTDRAGTPKRFWWPQGGTRPLGEDPVPAWLNWDCWLGPAPVRPFLDTYKEGKFQGKHVYHPFVWRGWWDFGTGALGDIGCHAMSGPFTALKIEHASAVELVKDTGDNTSEMFPTSAIIRWDIPARAGMPPCKLFWYDGGLYPPHDMLELPENAEMPDNGTVFIGDKGKLRWGHSSAPVLIPESKMNDFQPPPKTLPRCESNHFVEWTTACKGGRPAFSNFDHAGPLTELVLLGNLAIRAGLGKKVEWDSARLKVKNLPKLNQFVRREYRKGWEI